MILAAGHGDEEAAALALERLVRRYWPAVYAYIRSTGRDVHAASDLTQGFICDVVISRRLCAGADPSRGRFRNLLLSAVSNYLKEDYRHTKREERRRQRTIPMRFVNPDEVPDTVAPRTPEAAFHRQWSATLVHHVLDGVRRGCLADGLDAHWTIFEHRVVRPLLFGDRPTGYDELVGRLDLKDASQAANMMVTVKRRFANALCEEVSRTVSDRDEVTCELAQLLRDFEAS
jgi:RNA polymerase sigma-70 factor (ECF subfamily)